MEELKTMSTETLIDKFVEWTKLAKDADAEIKKIETEIQSRALAIMESKRIKTVEFYGATNGNSAFVQKAAKVSLLKGKYAALKSLFGDAVEDFIKEETEPSYTPLKKFKEIAGPLFLGDYEAQSSVAEILDSMGFDAKTSKTVLRKLKGDWQKDRKLIKSVCDIEDVDTWLYIIEQALVWEKVLTIFGKSKAHNAAEELKRSVLVEESLKIGAQYQEDDDE